MSGGVLTSRQNPLVRHMKKLGSDRGYRLGCEEFLCDGEKLLNEAVQNGAEITHVLYSGDLPDAARALPAQSASQEIVDYVSPLKNAQELLFSCRMPDAAQTDPGPGRHILLEGLRDPGNVGAVLRTAAAFGIDSVILLDCVDIYNPKTLRASMGAVFRQRVIHVDIDALPGIIGASGLKLYAATPGGDCVDVRSLPRDNVAVAIGGEGSGLSDRLIHMSGGRVAIPMEPGCESLNAAVAAAVVMWELKR